MRFAAMLRHRQIINFVGVDFMKSNLLSSVTLIIVTSLGLLFSSGISQTRKPPLQEKVVNPITVWPTSTKRFALIIGIDNYDDDYLRLLHGAANDAKILAETLIRNAGFSKEQVILLTTDQTNENRPTRSNILRRLFNLRSRLPKDGLLLVSFSGHGIQRGGKAFLLPSDAQANGDTALLEDTAISTDGLKDRIRQTGVQQVIIILDACRDNPEPSRSLTGNPLSEAYTRSLNFDTRNKEVMAFATLYATQIGKVANEYREKKQGYFTWALVEGLKGAAANEKGEITLAGLKKYIEEEVPRRTLLDLGRDRQQKPFAVIEGYKAEELVIATAKSVSAPSDPTLFFFRMAGQQVYEQMDIYAAVFVNGSDEITAADISLKYDEKLFEVKSVRDGGLLRRESTNRNIPFTTQEGHLSIKIEQPQNGPAIQAKGQLLLIIFKAKNAGKGIFRIDNQHTTLRAEGQILPIKFGELETEVTILPYIR
jgi:hypothetical protein